MGYNASGWGGIVLRFKEDDVFGIEDGLLPRAEAERILLEDLFEDADLNFYAEAPPGEYMLSFGGKYFGDVETALEALGPTVRRACLDFVGEDEARWRTTKDGVNEPVKQHMAHTIYPTDTSAESVSDIRATLVTMAAAHEVDLNDLLDTLRD